MELDGRFKVEIAYHNESRTGTARAVLYDGNFAHDSTQTNIWGMEVAVGADGRVQAVVPMGTEGVSGDTEIPEGGFVLSAGYALYRSYFERLEAGCTAEYVEKDGVYFFYALESVRYNASRRRRGAAGVRRVGKALPHAGGGRGGRRRGRKRVCPFAAHNAGHREGSRRGPSDLRLQL